LSDVYFAYDGSVHGEWVSHYAARIAARSADKRLRVVHVRDDATNDSALDVKLGRIRTECKHLGVEIDLHVQSLAGTVFRTIATTVPAGPDTYLISGIRNHGRALLRGTVSEQLLRSGLCNVLAVRVVQPGLLGLPRRLLLPVSEHPQGFRSGLPFLRLMQPDILRLQIFYVEHVSHRRFQMLSHESAEQLRHAGQAYCERIEQEIKNHLALGPTVMHANVVVSGDVPREIVIAANKTKSRLIYLGASVRNLTERLFYGDPIEQVLHDATCDVAVYRGVE
jgi:nucleotide-binding universal stress UspA family protein